MTFVKLRKKRMNLSTRIGLSLAALSLVVLAPGLAQAQTVNGTFGFVPLGRITYTGQSLDTATTVTIPNSAIVNNVDGTTYLGNPNQFNGGAFALTLGQPVTWSGAGSSITIPASSNPTIFGSPFLTFVAGGETFDYSITQVTSFVGTSTLPGASLAFDTLGVLTSSGTTHQLALLSGSFTQTGPGAAVNGSFTFSTPLSVPEPSSVALLFSMSMTGAGFLARRRKQARKVA